MTIISWVVFGQEISYLQWGFIGVLFVGLFVTSAGDSILKRLKAKNSSKEEEKNKDLKETQVSITIQQ